MLGPDIDSLQTLLPTATTFQGTANAIGEGIFIDKITGTIRGRAFTLQWDDSVGDWQIFSQ